MSTQYSVPQVYPSTPLLCIIDFEATCWQNKKALGPDNQGFTRPRMEIIEFGCVLVRSDTLSQVSLFQSFVRPKLNPVLTDFCTTLTSIQQKDVDKAPTFPEVLSKFETWLNANNSNRDNYTFGSWGFYDRDQFKLDCDLHSVKYPFSEDHFNIKMYVGNKQWGGKGVGVSKAATRLGIKFEGTPHRGIDDAYMITKILRRVEGKG